MTYPLSVWREEVADWALAPVGIVAIKRRMSRYVKLPRSKNPQRKTARHRTQTIIKRMQDV
jgi:hypothetical protein